MNWKCPYCDHVQTVVDEKKFEQNVRIIIKNTVDVIPTVSVKAVGCSNQDCRKLTITAKYTSFVSNSKTETEKFRLRPRGSAKRFPEYIPAAIREDYEEACAIVDLSPKAAATLARRAIQGMIRDFAGISEQTLYKEIDRLRQEVDERTAPPQVAPETIDALDHVRQIGNIGAHMERDVELIIPVDPDEAQTLIQLIEMLFEEWYVARETRKARLERLKQISDDKKALKADPGGAASIIVSGSALAKG